MTEPALTLLFNQRFGALDRIVSLLRRRGFPVAGVTVERTHRPEVGRMTVVVQEHAVLEQVSRHLRKLPDVLAVSSTSELDAVHREYALIRIRCTPQQRPEVTALLSPFDARVVSVNAGYLVIEVAGRAADLDLLFAELAPYGIEDSARTHPIVVSRQSTALDPAEQELAADS